MANEPKQPHELHLDGRMHLRITGVGEVESFDEETVALHTAQGVLVVRVEGLKLKTLSIDGGQVAVDGRVDALSYEEAQRGGGFFRRLFG